MIPILPTPAKEESAYTVTVYFYDTAGNALDVTTASWSLHKPDGSVVNSRSAVAIESPGTSVTIALTGDDLGIAATERGAKVIRTLTIEAAVSTTTYKDAIRFEIIELPAVS